MSQYPDSHPKSTPITDLDDNTQIEHPKPSPYDASTYMMKRTSHSITDGVEDELDSKRQIIDHLIDDSNGKCYVTG